MLSDELIDDNPGERAYTWSTPEENEVAQDDERELDEVDSGLEISGSDELENLPF